MSSRRRLLTFTGQFCRVQPSRPVTLPATALRTVSTPRPRSTLPHLHRPLAFATPSRWISSTRPRQKTEPSQQPAATGASDSSKIYSFDDVQAFVSKPDPHRIIIDVREPAELQQSGTIPTALNIPITSSPDALFLPADEFEDRFGFPKPDAAKEVVFFCKAGVRSRAAAGLARNAGYGRTAEFPGSWIEWSKNGGAVERSGGST